MADKPIPPRIDCPSCHEEGLADGMEPRLYHCTVSNCRVLLFYAA
jgi:hypothetical protein